MRATRLKWFKTFAIVDDSAAAECPLEAKLTRDRSGEIRTIADACIDCESTCTALFEDNSYCGETLSPCPSLDSKDTCKTVCERYPKYFFSRDVESICGRRFDANPTYGVIEQRREICGEQCDTSNTLWGSRKGLIDEVQVSLDDSAPSSTSLEAFPLRFCLNAVMGSDGQPTGDCTYCSHGDDSRVVLFRCGLIGQVLLRQCTTLPAIQG